MNEEFKNGIVPDPRTEAEKARDYQHSETAGDVFLNWVEKKSTDWKRYIPREQDGSLSCCGQSAAKALEILGFNVTSAHPIYRSRINFPEGGMFLQNVGDVCRKIGTVLESMDVSEFQNEAQMNRDITVTPNLKIGSYKFVDPTDIEKIAEAIELNKHCILITHCAKSEWIDTPVYNGKPVDFGHCVCAVDYFLYNGQKYILIEDSTGHFNSLPPNKEGQRLLTADFLQKRFAGAMYLITKYVFTKTLKFGMTSSDVAELQKKLQSLGYFSPTQAITQYFGNITLSAVKAFQGANHLTPDGVVGPMTNAVLNKL